MKLDWTMMRGVDDVVPCLVGMLDNAYQVRSDADLSDAFASHINQARKDWRGHSNEDDGNRAQVVEILALVAILNIGVAHAELGPPWGCWTLWSRAPAAPGWRPLS